jgi:chaperonin GroES
MAKAKKPAPKKTPAKKTAKPTMKAKPTAKKAAPAKAKVAAKKSAVSKAPAKKATPVKAIAKSAVKSTPARAATTTLEKKSESYFQSYLKPLDDRMVVLVGANERVTPGGLFIPDTVTDVSGNFQGKVMAIGRGHMNKKGRVQPLDVALGDKVVFSQFAGSQIDVDGNNIMIIRESDVLGIVK